MKKTKTKNVLPSYLNDKILKGVAFLNKVDEPKEKIMERMEFLKTEKNYSDKDISYILLLLSLPIVDRFFNEPEHIKLAKQFQFGSVDNRTIN
jgi:hypothetical protein